MLSVARLSALLCLKFFKTFEACHTAVSIIECLLDLLAHALGQAGLWAHGRGQVTEARGTGREFEFDIHLELANLARG